MRNGEQGNGGLTPTAARTLEYSIIGLGVFALLMIFQPFSISLFTSCLWRSPVYPSAR
jgi:hypothetical protein